MSLTLLLLKILSFATHRLRSNSFLPFIFRLLSTWAPALLYLSGALNRRRNRFSPSPIGPVIDVLSSIAPSSTRSGLMHLRFLSLARLISLK